MAAISLPTTSLWVGSGVGCRLRGDGLAGPRCQLPGGGLVDSQHLGHFGERHGETVVQHESDPLIGVEPLQHHHRREPGILAGHHRRQRVSVLRSKPVTTGSGSQLPV